MKRNYVLICIVSTIILCFSFSCKHAITSATLATPEDYRQDCIRYAGLNSRPGSIEEEDGVMYWEYDRIAQFKSDGNLDETAVYNYLITGGTDRFTEVSTRTTGSLDENTFDSLKIKCKQLDLQNPSQKGILAVFVKGELDTKLGKTECVLDIFNCKKARFVASYSKLEKERQELEKERLEQEKIRQEREEQRAIERRKLPFTSLTKGDNFETLTSEKLTFYGNTVSCIPLKADDVDTYYLIDDSSNNHGNMCETVCDKVYDTLDSASRKKVKPEYYVVCNNDGGKNDWYYTKLGKDSVAFKCQKSKCLGHYRFKEKDY